MGAQQSDDLQTQRDKTFIFHHNQGIIHYEYNMNKLQDPTLLITHIKCLNLSNY